MLSLPTVAVIEMLQLQHNILLGHHSGSYLDSDAIFKELHQYLDQDEGHR